MSTHDVDIFGEPGDPRDWPRERNNRVTAENTPLGTRRLVYPDQLSNVIRNDESFFVHRNVIIIMSRTHDDRSMLVVESMSEEARTCLFAVKAHKGVAQLYWNTVRDNIPAEWINASEVTVYPRHLSALGTNHPDDSWTIYHFGYEQWSSAESY